MTTRVAVLGTGRMGSAIARRLAETGLELVVWNRTRSRSEDVGAGTVAGTPADAVAMVDIVITSLTGPDALRATFGGPTGALAGARGQSFVEMSTAGPDVLEELAPLVARTGSTLVDAPVIGAPPAVLKGAELVIAGGERTDIERVRPVLERLGELRHVGPLGSGARDGGQGHGARSRGDLRRPHAIRAVARGSPRRLPRGPAPTDDVRAARPSQGPRPRAKRVSPGRRARPDHGARPRMGR
jgi:hypothetical protein